MRTKIYILTVMMFFIAFPVYSESWEAIKNSHAYLWGEGWGNTLGEADNNALKDLISKISVQVAGNVSHEEAETIVNDKVDSRSSFNSVINTYSSATLTNTEKVILKNEPDAHVGRWIRRADVAKIFEGRKHKISDYISSALKAESQGKIDIALKDLYWALALTKTLQDPNDYKYVDEDDEAFLAVTWIPHYINELFNNIDVDILKRTEDEVELMITYKGKPVNSIDYTYFDGRDWSNICSAKDGLGLMELAPGAQSSHYQIKFEYEYRGEAQIDREIESVLNVVSGIPMRNATKTIKSDLKAHGEKAKSLTRDLNSDLLSLDNSFASVSPAVFKMPSPATENTEMQKILDSLASSIVNKRYDEADGLFTKEAKEIYDRLIKYGRAKIVGKPKYVFYKYGENMIARGLQMSFSFNTGMRKSFVEEVIFSFDKGGKINNISFGLGKTAEADILGKGVWPEKARFALMNFLENYQTAYALKRLDYISSIFDDDAVIITGTVARVPAKKSSGDIGGMQFEHDIIKYNRHTKDSYLRQLRNSFNSKEYINIRFASNDVRKLGKGGELYSIQISQEYYSSNYGDKGYLFLMVDINDPDNPIIKVRTWQPEKDPDFGIYGPEHFK